MKNRYILPDYSNDIDEVVFDFQNYGKEVYRPKQTWEEGKRIFLIAFNNEENNEGLHKHIKLNSKVIPEIKQQLISIVKKNWDCFCKKCEKTHTIMGYEFSIDRNNAKPVFCGKPQYEPYKSNNIMEQVQALLKNVWIDKCGVPWSIRILLATKPYQEHFQNIDGFI